MFCPQCAHRQVSNDTRFCSRCGLPLGLVTDLVANSSNQLQREKREISGIGLMMVTVLMLLNFIIVFGAVALPHLAHPIFLWLWATFVVGSLMVGGLGLTNLIRGGFFKRLKERERRLQLMKERQLFPEEVKSASDDVKAVPRLVEPASVTETTTRELETIRKQTAETSRKKEAIAKE